jgi:two-component system, chemotaxis family, sensor kinase CheA
MSGMDEFKDLYIQTARERITQLNDLLIKLEANPTQLDIIQELMRAGHSLKGESAAMGYEKLATLAHVIEDLFTGIGNGSLSIKPELMDQLFSAVDRIQQSVDGISANNQEADTQDLVDTIKKITGLTTDGFGKTDKSKPIVASTSADTPPATTPETPPTPEVASTATSPAPVVAGPPPANNEVKAGDKISTVTLKVEKLDQMISISEELVLLKMKLKTNSIVEGNAGLKAEMYQLDRLVTDMQFHIMQARLFPISLALTTVPRLVRDTSKKTGKNVRLEIEGDDTTVDRTIIDHLTEPFVHMIRNAIDHGIESAEERKAAGKPEQAVVKIKAYTKENKFYIDISDDGAGIDWKKLGEAGVRKGYCTAQEAATWSDKQMEQLLYMGGVSTNKVVTDVSGRGVGMGAVQKAIQKLSGSIDIKTKVGVGTTFILKLPMTLAIIRALLVKVGHQTYAVPANNIVRSIQVKDEDLIMSGNTLVTVVDNQRVALYNLEKLFDLEHLVRQNVSDDQQSEKRKNSFKTVVLIRLDDEMFGCLVDKILAEEEILVKPLGPLLKQAANFSGATILADGAAAPIINVEGLRWK